MEHNSQVGFTLIELSIVLVIIGLIVGGVLVGQDLIRAASIRAQISQIEQFNAAANSFLVKFGFLPGDIPPSQASQIGLFTRAGIQGDGDGNGKIEGLYGNGGIASITGEGHFFWTDLSATNLVAGNFTDSTDGPISASTPQQLETEMPIAKIGNGNYVNVTSLPAGIGGPPYAPFLGNNYFLIQKVTGILSYALGVDNGMTPLEAQAIDTKMDDGQSSSGRVVYTDNYSGNNAQQGMYIFYLTPPFPAGDTTCVSNARGSPYNTSDPALANAYSCGLTIQLE